MIADHRDGIVEANHLAHTFKGHGFAVVHALQLAAEDRTRGDRGEGHAGDHCVDAELRLAVHLFRRVEALCGRPDEGKVLGTFERDILRHGKFRGRADESAIFESLPGRRNHLALFGATRGWLDLPLGRGRLDQHDPSRCSGAA